MYTFYYEKYPKTGAGQWIAGFIVAFCGFTGGISLVWAASVYPKVHDKEVTFTLNELEKGSIASFIHIGAMLAMIPSSYMQNALGRRCVLILTIPLQLLAWLLIYFLHYVWAILSARIMMGLWMGFYMTACPAYMSEASEITVRGRMIAQLKIMNLFGYFFQTIVGAYLSYDGAAFISFMITFFLYLSILYIPESIYSLLRLNRPQEALRALQWLRGKEDVREELAYKQRYLNEQMARNRGWGEIFRWPASRKAFVQALSLVAVQRLSGFPALSSYVSIILPNYLIHPDRYYPMLWATINLIFLLISVLCVDHIDRKVLLAISNGGCSLSTMLVAIWFYLYEKTTVDMSKTLWLPMLFLSIHAAFYSIGLFYIPMLFIGEIFPMNVKAKAASILDFIGFFLSVISVQLYIPFADNVGSFFNFLMYSFISLVGCFMSMRIVETRRRTLEHIQKVLEGFGSTEESRVTLASEETLAK